MEEQFQEERERESHILFSILSSFVHLRCTIFTTHSNQWDAASCCIVSMQLNEAIVTCWAIPSMWTLESGCGRILVSVLALIHSTNIY